ncbi:MAG TPA: hypothetical protein VF183_08255 [Acidimicrobiales bacterium]
MSTAWSIARGAVRALSLVVIAASGGYLLVYLYRWEWNRALMSGLFFLAAIVTFSTSLILGAFRGINDRLDRIEGVIASSRRAGPGAGATHRGEPPPVVTPDTSSRSRHFDWLREPIDGFGVFIPVLIGAGVVLSGVAYVIERVAGMLAGISVDRRTARLLEPDLALSDAPGLLPRVGARREHPRSATSRVLALIVALAVATLALVGGINALAEATQSRDEVPDPTQATVVDVHIRQKRVQRPDDVVADALWTACQGRLPQEVSMIDAVDLGNDRVRVTFDHALGDLSRRRLFGCFEDGVLDFVVARVERFELRPK